MNTLTKWLLILIGVPLLLVVVAIGLLKLIVSDEMIRTAVVPVVEQETGRKLTLTDASLHFFPSIGVTLKEISLPDDPAFSADPFVSVGEIRVNLDLFSLISQEIVIREILVDSPTIRVIKNRAGVYNFDSMIKADTSITTITEEQAPATESPAETSSPLDLSLEAFDIMNARIVFTDEQSGLHAEIRDLDYHLELSFLKDSLSLNHQLTIMGIYTETIAGKLADGLSVSVDQDLSYHLTKQSLDLRRSQVKVGNLELAVSGSSQKVSDSLTNVSFKIASMDTDMKQFLSLVPVSLVKDLNAVDASGSFRFSATIDGLIGGSRIPAVTYDFSLTDGRVKYSGFPEALQGIQIDLAGTEKDLTKGNFKASVAGSSVNVSASVRNFENPEVSINANVNLSTGDVKKFYPLDSLDVSGSVFSNVSISGPVLNPKLLKGSGSIRFDNLKVDQKGYLPTGIHGISGEMTINNATAELKRFKLLVGSSDIELSGKLSDYLGFVLSPEEKPLIPSLVASLRSSNLVVGDFVDLKSEPETTTDAVDTVKVSVPALPAMTARFDASIGRFEYDNIRATDITSRIELKDQSITLSDTKANLLGGSVKTNGQIRLFAPDSATFRFDLDTKNINADATLETFPAIEEYIQMGAYLDGTLNTAVLLQGRLTDSLTLEISSLTANGFAGIPSGKLSGHPIQTAVAGYLNSPGLNNLELTNFQAGIEIKDGKLFIEDLKTEAGGSEILVNGWQGLDQTVNYEMTLFLPPGMSDGLNSSDYGKVANQAITDSKNRVITDLLVTGTLTKPVIKPDAGKTAMRAASAVGKKIQEEVQKVTEEVKQEVQQQVDQVTDDAKKKAEEAARKAAEEAKKKLKIRFP